MAGQLFSYLFPEVCRPMSCTRDDLRVYLDTLLVPEKYRDYCPNGLQIEGKEVIHRLVTGVTACQALIDQAIEVGRTRFWSTTVFFGGRRILLLLE